MTDFTASFARKSDMMKARTWLANRSILAKATDDNRLIVLVPSKIDGTELAKRMTAAGF